MQGWSDGSDIRLVTIFSLEYGIDENNLTMYRENQKYEKVHVSYFNFYRFIEANGMFKFMA